MRIALIGGVRSTLVVLEKLHTFGFSEVFVFGYHPPIVDSVSAWVDLETPSARAGFTYTSFQKVTECRDQLMKLAPDVGFAVGLSQIIPKDILNIPIHGFIGFHPTKLPLGRGRAPLAWLILDQMNGASTFFAMHEGVDDGPILSQVSFSVTAEDDASSVESKMLRAQSVALDSLLPKLASQSLAPLDQDDNLSTYYGRRSPSDGWIDWTKEAQSILLLIKASTNPHPGAYTFHGDSKVTIWKAEPDLSSRTKGVVGRIVSVNCHDSFSVQCGDVVISVIEWSASNGWVPIVGMKLGFYSESEIYQLRAKVCSLEARVAHLESITILPDK